MGKVYKDKKSACPLCKPHKRGWADKMKPKYRNLDKVSKSEMRRLKVCLQD